MSVQSHARVFAMATSTARADLSAIYTWKSWLGGWLVRVLAQVTFFALIGRLIATPQAAQYLAIGNAVAIVIVESMMVVASTSWERSAGTLPLLVAAPGSLFPVFVGRSVQWLFDGLACSCIALFAVGALFGVSFTVSSVPVLIGLIALIAVSVYALGLVVASIVLRAMTYRNVASNIGYLLLMALSGAQVPVSFWPHWVRVMADFLPVTHGLHAVRDVVARGAASGIARQAGLEAATALGWFVVAGLSFRWLAESGRRDGSIEFS